MLDTSTAEPLSVSNDGDAGPYIVVPVSQIENVRSLLDERAVPYWVDPEAISLDGKPEVTVVNLGTGADPAAVQKLLDNTR